MTTGTKGINSVDTLVRHAQGQVALDWPEKVVDKLPKKSDHKRALIAFDEILQTRAPDHWRPADLTLAARLAKWLILLNTAETDLANEGLVIDQPSTTGAIKKAPNPLVTVINTLATNCRQARTKLGLDNLGVPAPTRANHARKNPTRAATAEPTKGKPDWARMARKN